jgi:pterin-4a-carbinolamine dehydratase
MDDRISADDFDKESLGGWQVDGTSATAEFTCGSFSAAGEFATKVAAICDAQNHHAEIDIRYPDIVKVTTTSHDVGGLSRRDVDLARAVSESFKS